MKNNMALFYVITNSNSTVSRFFLGNADLKIYRIIHYKLTSISRNPAVSKARKTDMAPPHMLSSLKNVFQ